MKRLFLFIGLFFLLAFSADFLLAKVFDSLYQRTRTGQTGGEINQYLVRSTPKALIMGNSRARYQVNPDSFAIPTYSLCHAGMGQVFQTGLLEVLAREKKLPRVILLHIDFEEYTGEDNLEDIGNLRYYYRKIPVITTEIDKISRFEKVKYLFSFYRYNGRVISTIKNYIQSRNADNGGNGYHPIAPIANDSTTFQDAPPVSDANSPKFYYQNMQHLQEFISVCKRHNVKLLCFTSPYFSPRAFAPIVSRPIDSLLASQRVPYFNATTHPLPILVHHARFWQDLDHLNELGAGYYSQQLAQWANPILVADSSAAIVR